MLCRNKIQRYDTTYIYYNSVIHNSRFPTLLHFRHNFFIVKNWCRQIQIMTLLEHLYNKQDFWMIQIFMLIFFYLYTFAAVCLLLWKFLRWKIYFWHHPNISLRPTSKNSFVNWLQILFISTWNVWMMSDTVNFLKKIHEPFTASWPQKMEHSQNEETRSKIFKKSIYQCKSYQSFVRNPSIPDNKTN